MLAAVQIEAAADGVHHTDEVTCLALLPDGLRFVSGSADGTARIVELAPH